MKKIIQHIFVLFIVYCTISCEKVIDVNLDTATPKLVIDANIKWQKGTLGNEQKIKLSTTTSYYSLVAPPVLGATVTLINQNTNENFTFAEIPNTGEYSCITFNPIIGNTYILSVISNGQQYQGTETLMATPLITTVEQETVPGFEDDIIQVKYFYQDNGSQNNFYLNTVKQNNILIPEFSVDKDEFFQGNLMFGFYTEEKLKATDILDLSVQGISESYYNYMNKLISIASTGGGNPFSTPPATLKGNMKNLTDSKNFPLGFFSLGEVDTRNYIVN